mmetsp:Transcript_17450/g.28177  ORF Transcript_17450/g.28177 Transcript_17450/m.28177 type:complete len:458 (+) Transcript_17450:312-1685(+)
MSRLQQGFCPVCDVDKVGIAWVKGGAHGVCMCNLETLHRDVAVNTLLLLRAVCLYGSSSLLVKLLLLEGVADYDVIKLVVENIPSYDPTVCQVLHNHLVEGTYLDKEFKQAVVDNQEWVARMLIEIGAVSSTVIGAGYVPERMTVVRTLLESAKYNRALLQMVDKSLAILRVACTENYVDVSLLVLPTLAGQCMNKVLQRVCCWGGYEVARSILSMDGVDASALSNVALFYACVYGHTELVELLLGQPGVDPTDRNGEILKAAAENYDWYTCCRLLLHFGRHNKDMFDVSTFRYVLEIALRKDALEIVEIVCSLSTSPLFTQTDLYDVIECKSERCIDIVLSAPAVDPSHNSNSALGLVLQRGSLQMVGPLIRYAPVQRQVRGATACIKIQFELLVDSAIEVVRTCKTIISAELSPLPFSLCVHILCLVYGNIIVVTREDDSMIFNRAQKILEKTLG